jgi:SAM-dependent methyltransferase
LIRALAFLSDGRPLDYGSRASRLRWRRAVEPEWVRDCEWLPDSPAAAAIDGAEIWFVVTDPAALPLAAGPIPQPPSGRVLACGAAVPIEPPFVHTLRELEGCVAAAGEAESKGGPAALAFRTADFPPSADETVKRYIERLLDSQAHRAVDSAFRAFAFDGTSERERPELTRRLPSTARLRILDSGCGAGAGIAGARERNPGWIVTGIERDPGLAARARGRCDRVLEGDLAAILPALAAAGERFDALVFADVLEHLDDPVAALAAGRRIAAPGAMLLASVPNVGHLSLVRDLVAGRFDPIPAGLTDARHLRWFTRSSLAEALEEAGWRTISIEAEPGAPAPDAAAFLALAAAWPDCDGTSLTTYQWVAIGSA